MSCGFLHCVGGPSHNATCTTPAECGGFACALRNCEQFDLNEAGASVDGADAGQFRIRSGRSAGPSGTVSAAIGAAGAGPVAGVLECNGACCPATPGLKSRPDSCIDKL
jgi:hypothetical protein